MRRSALPCEAVRLRQQTRDLQTRVHKLGAAFVDVFVQSNTLVHIAYSLGAFGVWHPFVWAVPLFPWSTPKN